MYQRYFHCKRNWLFTSIQAVYSVAHGLHRFLEENCDNPVQWNRTTQACKGQKITTNSSVIFDYIAAANFTAPGTGIRVAFDKFGNPVVSEYKVFNFQKMSSGEKVLTEIGMWDSVNGIVLHDSQEIQFGLDEDGNALLSFESQCQLCKPGKIQVSFQASCCNLCVPCTDDTYADSNTSSKCQQCGPNMWGNNPVNGRMVVSP